MIFCGYTIKKIRLYSRIVKSSLIVNSGQVRSFKKLFRSGQFRSFRKILESGPLQVLQVISRSFQVFQVFSSLFQVSFRSLSFRTLKKVQVRSGQVFKKIVLVRSVQVFNKNCLRSLKTQVSSGHDLNF